VTLKGQDGDPITLIAQHLAKTGDKGSVTNDHVTFDVT